MAAALIAGASSLNLSSQDVQSGSDVTLQCDPGGITLAFTTAWLDPPGAPLPDFYVTGVEIGDIDQPACQDHQIKIVLDWIGFAETSLASQTDVSTDLNFVLTSPRPASALVGWHIAIHTGPTF
jgi:hypothetical protein